ncbi:MAG TPA: hypothetical protein VIB02_00735, partial [Candidatus Limnocylindrales bacterium]
MPRLRYLVAAILGCALGSLIVGAAATASVAPGTLAIQVLPADVEPSLPVPPECAGMAFERTIVGTEANDVIKVAGGATLVFGLG